MNGGGLSRLRAALHGVVSRNSVSFMSVLAVQVLLPSPPTLATCGRGKFLQPWSRAQPARLDIVGKRAAIG